MQKVSDTMSEISNFFSKRRSVMARKMSSEPIDKNDLNVIIVEPIKRKRPDPFEVVTFL